jgi:hypothetical protein
LARRRHVRVAGVTFLVFASKKSRFCLLCIPNCICL